MPSAMLRDLICAANASPSIGPIAALDAERARLPHIRASNSGFETPTRTLRSSCKTTITGLVTSGESQLSGWGLHKPHGKRYAVIVSLGGSPATQRALSLPLHAVTHVVY